MGVGGGHLERGEGNGAPAMGGSWTQFCLLLSRVSGGGVMPLALSRVPTSRYLSEFYLAV
jgi:hypothetical protein